jgi:basic amino acid/polyamine antiporter, APA family
VALLQATALLTVAYQDAGTGPSQAARSVKQTRIAGGMVILLQGLLYVGVALVSLRTIKASVFGTAAVVQVNSLMSVMQHLPLPGGASLIAAGGTVALAGLILKLLPQLATRFIDLNQSLRWSEQTQNAPAATPLSSRRAVRWVSIMLSCMVLAGDVKTLWSLSAFALLLQAAISHWIRFRYGLYPRFYGRWLQAFGCGVCLFLAFWIDGLVGLTSLGLVALGLVWRGMMQWSNEQE